MLCRNDCRRFFYDFNAAATDNNGVVYAKLPAIIDEDTPLRQKVDAIKYIGERTTTRAKRASTNNHHAM